MISWFYNSIITLSQKSSRLKSILLFPSSIPVFRLSGEVFFHILRSLIAYISIVIQEPSRWYFEPMTSPFIDVFQPIRQKINFKLLLYHFWLRLLLHFLLQANSNLKIQRPEAERGIFNFKITGQRYMRIKNRQIVLWVNLQSYRS